MRSGRSDRGLAMITALMVLSFLTVIGAAMLYTTDMDVRISYNYGINAQLLYLAEAGFESAREQLRVDVEAQINADGADAIETLSDGITGVLRVYDGVDLAMATSTDATVLLDTSNTDDVRYADTVSLSAGSDVIGTYTAFVRNDVVDGASSNTDTNEVVTIISIAQIGDATKVVEIDVKKGNFPDVPSAVTLNGSVPTNGYQTPTSSNFRINGVDEAGVEASVNGVGVVTAASSGTVTASITGGRGYGGSYCGENATPSPSGTCDGTFPYGTGPDVDDISGDLNDQLTTAAALVALAEGIASSATHTTCPDDNPWGSTTSPRVTYVDGDCSFSPNSLTGYGLLVVRGELTIAGAADWNGLVIVIDDEVCNPNGAGGTPHYAANISGMATIRGGIFVASIVSGVLGDACLNFNGGGGSNGGIRYNSENIRNAAAGLPFFPIAWREY